MVRRARGSSSGGESPPRRPRPRPRPRPPPASSPDSDPTPAPPPALPRPRAAPRHRPGRDAASTSFADLKGQGSGARSTREKPPPAGLGFSTSPKPKKKRGRDRDSGTSSEEERWLHAIKSGKLEEVDDELKKIKPKDPRMMTARQRAMYERSAEKEPLGPLRGEPVLLALPSGYKTKVLTAEAIQKAAIKSQKRKQLADEKREKNKKRTMDRLLKKQESRNAKNQKGKLKKLIPMMLYKNSINEILLSLPVGVDFPITSKSPIEAPKPVMCALPDCDNLKKYNCSKTNMPLCSLECYKKNLQGVIV